MKPVDGAELALWFQKKFRPQISEDVARYVAEFDAFREEMDSKSSADRGAYLDLPRRIQHQWELLAPVDVRPGRLAAFPVQVQSDLGPMVIGTYRAMVGMDRRISTTEEDLEWIPSFQRGVPTPRRPEEAQKIKPRTDSTEPIGGFVGLLSSFADAVEERAEGVLEELEVGEYSYERRSREMPIHRSTRDEVHKRAGASARNAVTKLSVPWSSSDEMDPDRLVSWLRRAREPVWLSKMDASARDTMWDFLKGKGGTNLFKTFEVVWAEEHGSRKPTQANFWGFAAHHLTVTGKNIDARCFKFDNKPIGLDRQGVCKETSCSLHPSKNRGILTKDSCAYQRIHVK